MLSDDKVIRQKILICRIGGVKIEKKINKLKLNFLKKIEE